MIRPKRAVGWAKRSVPTRLFESGLRKSMKAFPLLSRAQSFRDLRLSLGIRSARARCALPALQSQEIASASIMTAFGSSFSNRSLDEAQRNPG